MNKPVVRIVRMTFKPDQLEAFESLFDERSSSIRSFPGCENLELLQDLRYPNVMTTVSLWSSEEALAAYRESGLFKETWSTTKKLFAAPPQASSYEGLRQVDPGL